MDRGSPESLLQFMDNVTESVRAALERPVGNKEADHSSLLHKQLFDNQSEAKEQRRHKWHTRRRRHKFPQPPRNSHQNDQWECRSPRQQQVLSKILGISDPTKQAVLNDQHLTQWEQNLHQSPNACREYSDDSADGMLECHGQFNMEPQQGSVKHPEVSSQTDFPNYCQAKDQNREMYSQMTETQFTYSHNHVPRTLDEVLNTMPVGCHLLPPVHPNVSNFTAKRRPKQMGAASRRRKANITGVPESDGRYSPKQVTRTAREGSQLHPRSQDQYAEYCPNDVDLLSELVTELDKTQIFDKLTGESVFLHSPKDMTIEDMPAMGRRYAEKSNLEPGDRTDQSEFAELYENQKPCDSSNWGLLEWQGQFNMEPQQGSVTDPGASSHTDLPMHCQAEDQRREMYSQMTETQFTYTHDLVPRTLDEVVNMVPVGCHLPPPVHQNISNFTANYRPKQMDAASRRSMTTLGVPESDGRYSPPQATRTAREGSQLPPRSQVENIEYCPNDAGLLSQRVTEMDTAQCFDKLTDESTFQQSAKETYVEDKRSVVSRYSDKCNRERIDPSEFVYEDQKTRNGSEWGQVGGQAARQKRFATIKQRSFDLACTLQENQQNSHRFPDSRNVHSSNDVGLGLNGLKRNSASMEALQFDNGLGKENSGRMHVPSTDLSFPKHRKSNLLIAMHERRSMPNLYKHHPLQNSMSSSKVEHAKFSNERRFVRDKMSSAGSLEIISSHSFDNGFGAMDLNGSAVPKRHPKLQDIRSYSDCRVPLHRELNTIYDSYEQSPAAAVTSTSSELITDEGDLKKKMRE